jgi:hypothetical protein
MIDMECNELWVVIEVTEDDHSVDLKFNSIFSGHDAKEKAEKASLKLSEKANNINNRIGTIAHEIEFEERCKQEGLPYSYVPNDYRAIKLSNEKSLDNKWPGEICKRCHHRNVIGFYVPDKIWESVVQGRWNVLCPSCFDEEAEIAGVSYQFGELWPVSWSDWVKYKCVKHGEVEFIGPNINGDCYCSLCMKGALESAATLDGEAEIMTHLYQQVSMGTTVTALESTDSDMSDGAFDPADDGGETLEPGWLERGLKNI